MKQNILTIMIFLSIIIGIVGCEKDENTSNNTDTAKVTNLEGTVHFYSAVQQWGIAVPEKGTYDAVEIFLPNNLEEAYKKEDKKVRFSGRRFNLSSDVNSGLPVGSKYTGIELSSIISQ
ncbi:MAG: hypothetical protein LBP72_11215 [Dysgonamonadaceae bacterium]|jgi:hypothetical protein|nr:hypothetical protein [Dysgonamonadaceae bacterium]